MHNVAAVSFLLTRRPEDLKLYEEALALQKAKLGPDHPVTLLSMHNLADGYHEIGRYAEAVKLHEQTLALRKAVGVGSSTTFEELSQKCMKCNDEIATQGGKLWTLAEWKAHLGSPMKEQMLDSHYYLYYKVQEGTAQINLLGYQNTGFAFNGINLL